MPNEDSPLTDADLVQMNQKLAELTRAEGLIEKAIRGGIDMSTQQAQARELRQKIMKLKQSFFPSR